MGPLNSTILCCTGTNALILPVVRRPAQHPKHVHSYDQSSSRSRTVSSRSYNSLLFGNNHYKIHWSQQSHKSYRCLFGSFQLCQPSRMTMSCMKVKAKTTREYGPQARPRYTRPDPRRLPPTNENPVLRLLDSRFCAVTDPYVAAFTFNAQSCNKHIDIEHTCENVEVMMTIPGEVDELGTYLVKRLGISENEVNRANYLAVLVVVTPHIVIECVLRSVEAATIECSAVARDAKRHRLLVHCA